MLKKFIGYWLICLGINALQACGPAGLTQESNLDGDFRTEFINDAYTFEESPSDLASYYLIVDDKRKERPNQILNDFELTEQILTVAARFEIDPRILFSLVRAESTFDENAQSPTGAVGLTQFTEIGVKEVHDQLGARGKANALATTIAYWKDVIPETYEILADDIDAITEKTFPFPAATTSAHLTKVGLKTNPSKALIYGGVLLKTNLAVCKQKNPDLTMEELYTQALERYNGDTKVRDGKEEKVHYREKILAWAKEIL